MIKLIYVAGPFSAPTREGVERNIERAVSRGLEVARLGFFPVVPHANTSHHDYEHIQPYTFWIKGTLKLLTRCDGLLTVDGWQLSKGAWCEERDARAFGLPVFHDLDALAAHVW